MKWVKLFFFGVLITGSVLWSSAISLAAGVQAPAEAPNRVEVAIVVLDVDNVDTVNQSFQANVFYGARWHDSREAHKGPGSVVKPLTQVWNPRLQIVNQQRTWQTFPEVVEITPDGDVIYRQRVWGSFSQPLKLRDFPFDSQSFTLQLAAAGFREGQINLVPDSLGQSGISEELSFPDWRVTAWRAEPRVYQPHTQMGRLPGFAFTFDASRKKNYYVVKVIVPLIFIVMMSWVVFWTDPKESGTDIGVAVTSMLTLIAYRFAIGSFLPIISYLTRLDFFILGSTILVFSSLAEVVATSALVRHGRKDLAISLDRISRWVFPAIFVYLLFQTLVLTLPAALGS
jgi:hypothetical protein